MSLGNVFEVCVTRVNYTSYVIWGIIYNGKECYYIDMTMLFLAAGQLHTTRDFSRKLEPMYMNCLSYEDK